MNSHLQLLKKSSCHLRQLGHITLFHACSKQASVFWFTDTVTFVTPEHTVHVHPSKSFSTSGSFFFFLYPRKDFSQDDFRILQKARNRTCVLARGCCRLREKKGRWRARRRFTVGTTFASLQVAQSRMTHLTESTNWHIQCLYAASISGRGASGQLIIGTTFILSTEACSGFYSAGGGMFLC